MGLFWGIQMPSDKPVQYVGCYVLRWGDWPLDPEAGFIPVDDPPLPHSDQNVSVGEFLTQYREWYKTVFDNVE